MIENPIFYQDRFQAGRILAECLKSYRDTPDVLVLGLAGGGIPLAFEISRELEAELDVLVVSKLEVPGREYLSMGAISSSGVTIRNPDIVAAFMKIPDGFKRAAHRERKELLCREMLYHGKRPFPDMKGRCVILVDDGLESGCTMRAAIEVARRNSAARIVVAVPLGAQETVERMEEISDHVVCPAIPSPFSAIEDFYKDFSRINDGDVRNLLERSWNGSGISDSVK